MKKMLLAGFVMLLVFPLGLAYGEDVVTSKGLSIGDVKGYLSRQDWITLVEVHGIHQQGNKATVYYKGKEPVPDFIDKSGFHIIESTMELVRFNSGKWFVVKDGTFLTK